MKVSEKLSFGGRELVEIVVDRVEKTDGATRIRHRLCREPNALGNVNLSSSFSEALAMLSVNIYVLKRALFRGSKFF